MIRGLSSAGLAIFLAPSLFGQVAANTQTPAQQKIAWEQASIAEHPDHSQPYNDLAVAYVRRVRETDDVSYYDQAEASLQKSLKISPSNIEAQKASVMILLGRKQFQEALDLAKALNRKTPDDVLIYGLVADADIELGNYKDAETAAQWMLDLRPGNVPGLLRGARLRGLYGDVDGAIEFFSQAYQQTPPTQTEDLAWILTQMADLKLSGGNVDAAEKLLHSALETFPDYYLAMGSLSRLQAARQHINAEPVASK
jgi:tetratricopeptide (TPR) repeat protein